MLKGGNKEQQMAAMQKRMASMGGSGSPVGGCLAWGTWRG